MESNDFNSRPSARGDSDVRLPGFPGDFISIHAPPRGATPKPQSKPVENQFQFTPLREGRRRWERGEAFPSPISIHAPPRGATGRSETAGIPRHISIHAPPRGATRRQRRKINADGFQFTPLREGRLWQSARNAANLHFNSRPSARGDWRALTRRTTSPSYFNSRPSARGDARAAGTKRGTSNFNSRPSARGDT